MACHNRGMSELVVNMRAAHPDDEVLELLPPPGTVL
jgi:LmbE family N-acetylglucosaminyl deacetylase